MALMIVPNVNATLIASNDGTMVYDADLNVTWSADANLVYNSGYDTSNTGRLSWSEANTWISYLNSGVGYLGYNNWRLPTALNSDGSGPCSSGTGCTDSEMGHLFSSELGSSVNFPAFAGGTSQTYPFVNFQSDPYWTSTTAGSSVPFAWTFNFRTGVQDTKLASAEFYVLPIRDGNFVTVVPPPHHYLSQRQLH